MKVFYLSPIGILSLFVLQVQVQTLWSGQMPLNLTDSISYIQVMNFSCAYCNIIPGICPDAPAGTDAIVLTEVFQ